MLYYSCPGRTGERILNPGKELEKSSKEPLDSNTRKCYNRVKKTENRTPVSEQKKSLLYETWTSNAGTVQRFSNLTTTLQSVTIKAQNNIKRLALVK